MAQVAGQGPAQRVPSKIPSPCPCAVVPIDKILIFISKPMKTIPKPQHCGQCDTFIGNFTQAAWAVITRIHLKINDTVSRVNSHARLTQEKKQVRIAGYAKLAATTMLLMMGVTTGVFAQSPSSTEKTIIFGTVTGLNKNGDVAPLPGAKIYLKGSTWGTLSDAQGKYQIDLTRYRDTIQNPTLVFTMLDYKSHEVPLTDLKKEGMEVNAQLEEIYFDENQPFQAPQPRRRQRIPRRLEQ